MMLFMVSWTSAIICRHWCYLWFHEPLPLFVDTDVIYGFINHNPDLSTLMMLFMVSWTITIICQHWWCYLWFHEPLPLFVNTDDVVYGFMNHYHYLSTLMMLFMVSSTMMYQHWSCYMVMLYVVSSSWMTYILNYWPYFATYRKVSNISRTLVGNEIVDHSDVVGASPVGAAPTTSSFSNWTSGFNTLRKDNCMPRPGTFKIWDLVPLILEILR